MIHRLDSEFVEMLRYNAFVEGWCIANGVNWLRLSSDDHEDLRKVFDESDTKSRHKDFVYHEILAREE